jgi:hypothetical protein
MASTRSSTKQRRTRRAQSVETPKSALTELARRSARIEIAACTAAVQALAGWAQAADRFAQTIGDELISRVEGENDSSELIARLTAATSTHLRDLSALPRITTNHFDARLGRPTIDV